MSRNIYNIGNEAGISTETSSAGATMNTLNAERAYKLKEWFDTNFSDIFETEVTEATSTSSTINDVSCTFLDVFFKGTNFGFFVRQFPCFNSTSYAQGWTIGYSYNGARFNTVTSVFLYNCEVQMLAEKSKYGIIAGFYKDTISGNVRQMAVNLGDSFFPIYVSGNTVRYIYENQDITVTPAARAATDGIACLSKIYLPQTAKRKALIKLLTSAAKIIQA